MAKRKYTTVRSNKVSATRAEQRRFFTIVAVTTLIVLLLLYLVYRSTV